MSGAQEQHIATVFDRELESIQALVMKMGGIVEEMILDASRSLDDRDEELAQSVRRRDAEVRGGIRAQGGRVDCPDEARYGGLAGGDPCRGDGPQTATHSGSSRRTRLLSGR